MAVVIGILALAGNVKTTWSRSAFTVLVYYAINNPPPCACRRSAALPRWIAWAGLFACAFLAFWVEPAIWLAGLAAIGVGWLLRLPCAPLGRRPCTRRTKVLSATMGASLLEQLNTSAEAVGALPVGSDATRGRFFSCAGRHTPMPWPAWTPRVPDSRPCRRSTLPR